MIVDNETAFLEAVRGEIFLLVEDNDINQQVATELLENARLTKTYKFANAQNVLEDMLNRLQS